MYDKASSGRQTRTKRAKKDMAKVAKDAIFRMSETKRHNVLYNEFHQTTGTISSHELTNINQGDETNQRTGRQILGQGIKIRSFVHNNGTYEPIIVKFMMVQAKSGVTTDPGDATNPVWVKARHDNPTTFNVIGGTQALLYELDPDQYSVLYQKQFQLEASPYPNTTEDGARFGGKHSAKYFEKYIKLGGRKINFDSTTCQNKLWLVWWTVQLDSDQITGTDMEVSANCNLTFKDF